MDLMFEPDGLLSIDMDELGVRPFDWIDINKDIDVPINDYFGKEKTLDITVYSAELQTINNGKKFTTDEGDSSMSDEDGNLNYEIDPETGEKIFREVVFARDIALSSSSPSNDKWIEEYLSNIESSSSNQTLPNTTINNTNSDFNLENIPFSLIENTDEQIESDWLSNLINLDETSDSIMFTDPIIQNQFNENNSNQISPSTTTSMYVSLPNGNNDTLSVSTDDEYSTSSSSYGSRHNRLYSSLESDNDITLLETKLEKIDPDEHIMSQMIARRNSIRTNYGQQDEETLQRFNIPLTVRDITESSTEEYNQHLASLSHLTAEQIHIIKDIRRRGKNKIAAQNCRKRKAISVESLLEEIDELKRVKHELEERKRSYQQQIGETRNQYEHLHHQVLPDRQLPPAIIVK